MSHQVFLTKDAQRDLEELHEFIFEYDSKRKADQLLDQLEATLQSLSTSPTRGNYPKELSVIGLKEYREIRFKSYRLIYRVIGKRIYVYAIVDGRRDMATLLERRLLGV